MVYICDCGFEDTERKKIQNHWELKKCPKEISSKRRNEIIRRCEYCNEDFSVQGYEKHMLKRCKYEDWKGYIKDLEGKQKNYEKNMRTLIDENAELNARVKELEEENEVLRENEDNEEDEDEDEKEDKGDEAMELLMNINRTVMNMSTIGVIELLKKLENIEKKLSEDFKN